MARQQAKVFFFYSTPQASARRIEYHILNFTNHKHILVHLLVIEENASKLYTLKNCVHGKFCKICDISTFLRQA